MQKDVIAESAEILKLGLLFGEDTEATTEDLPSVLSFQHKLLQEYLAAIFIAENAKLDKTSTFLPQALPTWEIIEIHQEVVKFACGILAGTDASPITNHVSNVLAIKHIHDQLNSGIMPSILMEPSTIIDSRPLSLLASFHKEGSVSTVINPHLCEYPACGQPLAEVLASTGLVYITDIDKNDSLQLSASHAQIIVKLKYGRRYGRLWQALHDISANVIALDLEDLRSKNVTKLSHFFQLKYIKITSQYDYSEAVGEDLVQSIEAWGPQSQLTFCELWKVPISKSLMMALCKCSHLIHLHLAQCNLHDKLDVFMTTPPPALRKLILGHFVWSCSLHGSDVDHITQAFIEERLTHLEELWISSNPVGEVAVGHLLKALISTRPHTQFTLVLLGTGVDEDGECTPLSEQFVTEWNAKLTDTNINVRW